MQRRLHTYHQILAKRQCTVKCPHNNYHSMFKHIVNIGFNISLWLKAVVLTKSTFWAELDEPSYMTVSYVIILFQPPPRSWDIQPHIQMYLHDHDWLCKSHIITSACQTFVHSFSFTRCHFTYFYVEPFLASDYIRNWCPFRLKLNYVCRKLIFDDERVQPLPMWCLISQNCLTHVHTLMDR